MTSKTFQTLAMIATVLALCVVVLGAWVRLSDAGLGCPDWPGCYGRALVSQVQDPIEAGREYGRPFEAGKAWKEMIHRYFAGALGLLILALAIMAWRSRGTPGHPVKLPLLLLVLVVFQALLGMWTVTLLVMPVIVLTHLLGGLATMALLWLLTMRSRHMFVQQGYVQFVPEGVLPWAALGLVVVVCQIALGGWTSANYAALSCPDFPTCQQQWWPPMDFAEAFTLWREVGVDYEGGVLGNDARVTIHMMHRLGALVTLFYVGLLALRLLFSDYATAVRALAGITLLVLVVQVALGIANVVLVLPLHVAVTHNGVGALLLLCMVTLVYLLWQPRRT